jgi:L-ascorbate metabolism protein UlaG (beta-lactamase superfamily)
MRLPVDLLGQSGLRLSFPGATVYVDPYLSNSVGEHEGPAFDRLVPIPVNPADVDDADVVLITHDHLDHCDPQTLLAIARTSPNARFVGPRPVLDRLSDWGIADARLDLAAEGWTLLADDLHIRTVPAAHPEITRDREGNLACVGYLLRAAGRTLYISGDTGADPEVVRAVRDEGPIHAAILPVNERNHYRDRQGILGNMSVREAFAFAAEIGADQVVPVHWDMFAPDSVDPDEIRLLHDRLSPPFRLSLSPSHLSLGDTGVSIVIRTFNEARHLDDLLTAIDRQETHDLSVEVVVVDSGSTDGTLDIARRHDCRVVGIDQSEFSFGRSLNLGCARARGDIVVAISGHCVPVAAHWLQRLCDPLISGTAHYAYGRQTGGPDSNFSECRLFAMTYPPESRLPQDGFFCNNANAAILRETWDHYRFDEEVPGLEDMELARRLVADGGKVAYVAEAGVHHYHYETWPQVRRRFEREAIALRKVMPQVRFGLWDMLRYAGVGTLRDWVSDQAATGTATPRLAMLRYRWNQYLGAWRGGREHRKLSEAEKEKYFFPR